MIVDKHYIDKKIREELEGLEVNPPVEAWLAISDTLDQSSGPYKNILFMRTAAAIAALVVVSFSFWMLVVNENVQEAPLAQQAVPAAMEAIPLNHISVSGNPGALLADMTLRAPQTAYQSASLTPAVFYDTPSFRKLYPKQESVIRTEQSAPPGILPASSARSSPIALSQRDPYIETDSHGPRSSGSNVTIGAHFAPQYNYRTFIDRSGSEYRGIPFSTLESQIYTYSAGMSVSMPLSRTLSIQSGLYFNNMGQYIEGISAYQHPEYRNLYSETQYVITSLGGIRIYDTSHHFADISSYRVIDTKESLDPKILDGLRKSDEGLTQVFQFVEVPLFLRYKLTEHHIKLHVKGGVSGSYLLSKNVFMGNDISQNPIGETHGIKQFNFSVMAGFAMQLPVTGRLSLHLEPTAQLFLQPFVLEGLRMGSVLPYNFSLQTGLSYRF